MAIHTLSVVKVDGTTTIAVTREELKEGLEMAASLCGMLLTVLPPEAEGVVETLFTKMSEPGCSGAYIGIVGPNGPVNLFEIVVK